MRFFSFLALGALLLLVPSTSALAQGAAPISEPAPAQKSAPPPIDILPAKTAQTKGLMYNTDEITHPEIRMTPDKSELVRLEGNAASIIIGNPQHLNIVAESASLLVLAPRAPGATYFTVLDAQGHVLMQRHVLVDSPKEKYMRVRKSCVGANDKNCQTTSVYYCPDMCHQILIDDPSAAQGDTSGNNDASSSSAPAAPAESENPDAVVEEGAAP